LGVGGHALVSGCPEHWTIQP